MSSRGTDAGRDRPFDPDLAKALSHPLRQRILERLSTGGEASPNELSRALDSALGIAAAAHTARAMPQHRFASGLAHGLATSPLFADNVADDGMLTGPEIVAGDLPGLGVTVDEVAIERLRLR